ncbi:lysophospholipid acyltransferase family protein [Haloechinothrix sp. LS1_15]|uniref:lysophospholipid acyltransferase family protein n=1 Tax=Haloechinothrix sp. LS1_15 TaxID=2652248 RepID=UPI0029470793|nr:lysophospholipid acyltransferase family protein [Haloechinothrix sp. LS1_15]MDV6013488.1 1-acyl-sn-glycerol-3-phosphate acyltransferase [Haloechinothrix sp. LS1_15]
MAGREKGGFWVAFTAVLFYPLSWLAARRYRGAERVPRQGGALLVLNHVSHFDPVVDAVFVHRQRRVPRFMAKASLFRVPVLGRILRGSAGIPVYRESSASGDALREAHRTLREGKVVVIYPEGTITKDPQGWPSKAYTGVARLALANDVPVIPIARWGTNELLDGYAKKFRPLPRKTVTHNVGEPVDLSGYRDAGQPTPESLREVTDVLMAEVTTLLAEIRGEQPPRSKESTRVDGA